MTLPAPDAASVPPLLRFPGRVPYQPTVDAMKAFTAERVAGTPDEIWVVEHDPVFTQGLAGKAEHVLDAGDVPIVKTNRGGQVTFHGPGQVVAYPLVDLRRLGIYVRLDDPFGHAALVHDRPISDPFRGLGKIAALGVKVSNHCTYHGVALNVAMDLQPFGRINPCGYAGLKTVDLATLGVAADRAMVADVLGRRLRAQFTR